jgi:hypothetical protein
MSSSVARSALGIAVVALAGAITLTACSSSSGNASGGDPGSTSPAAASPSASGGAGGPGGAGQRGPAASGTVAAVDGTTMQVQNPQSGQIAVAWSSSTKFSHQVSTTLAAIKAGTCVTAIAPAGTSDSATSFTASTLAINPATNGSCTGGFGGGNGQRPSGFPSGQRPSGFPSGQRPSGFPSGQRANIGAIAAGSVTSVSGSSVVIAARQFTPGGGSGSGSSTTNKTVTIGSSTKITTEASTTASSVKVGKCVTAQGKADSSGTVAATTVRITDPVNGQCTATFGGRGGTGG